MTQEIKDKIEKEYPVSDIEGNWLDVPQRAKRIGAEFGYSLAQKELEEKDKEIERLLAYTEYVKRMVAKDEFPMSWEAYK